MNPENREERVLHLVGHWAHTLTHVAKVLARIGIRVITDTEDADDLRQSLVIALDSIDARPVSDNARGAIFAMTLRWMVVGDLISAYRQDGEQWRESAILDTLQQVEILVMIAEGLLDDRDAAN